MPCCCYRSVLFITVCWQVASSSPRKAFVTVSVRRALGTPEPRLVVLQLALRTNSRCDNSPHHFCLFNKVYFNLSFSEWNHLARLDCLRNLMQFVLFQMDRNVFFFSTYACMKINTDLDTGVCAYILNRVSIIADITRYFIVTYQHSVFNDFGRYFFTYIFPSCW